MSGLVHASHAVHTTTHFTVFQAAEGAVQQLEQKLLNEGTNWRLQFLRAKQAPQESFSQQFKQLTRHDWLRL